MSVIFGVLHMSFGLIMKAFNACYFNRKLDFKHEFIPQILMLLCMFGYMDILIITKWLTNYTAHENMAPSIISTMV
jgi:V-type H+-transporting ATPase subunit a